MAVTALWMDATNCTALDPVLLMYIYTVRVHARVYTCYSNVPIDV